MRQRWRIGLPGACEHWWPEWPVRGLSANQLECALISMMARSTTRSNQRPDTLMQDRICQVDETSCNARPDHTFGSKADLTAPKSNFRYTPQSGLRADIAPCPFRANSGLMHRNKISPIRHLVAAAEHRMRYHRIDRNRGFESRRQACRCLVERRFLGGEAEPSRAVSARLTVIARRTVTCCPTTNKGSC